MPEPVAQDGHACAACQGPLQRPAAEELWFYGPDVAARDKIQRALAAANLVHTNEQTYLKVAVTGAATPVLDAAAAALSPEECARVNVAWIISGTTPLKAVKEQLTLAALRDEMEHRWFARLLDERGLYMNFQPIVSLRHPSVHAHEALVRAEHDGREMSGVEVVTLAERTGLIVPLDARTRVTAIEQFSASSLQSKLFINFQPSAIYNPRYCLRTTFAALERSRLRPEDVVFEVVESEDIADVPHLLRIMQTYRDHGLGVALDDFGAGYSTAERLVALRPDYLKIDKSLTRNVAGDEGARRIVASIVRMAGDKGCRVIAEGIETVGQRDALRDLGVELGQGYLFARPARQPRVTWPS